MDWITEPERKTPVVADVDILVCGGGFAGVAAATCAAKNGTEVLLLENYGFLGGLVTAALVITSPPLNNGINIEIAKRLKKRSAYYPCFNSDAIAKPLKLHAIDPEVVKYELFRILQENNVEILLHTHIVSSIMENNQVKGIVMENKAGRQAVKAKIVVDATGDADIAAFSGAPFRLVKKPMTMMFNMVGVKTDEALKIFGNWGGIRKIVKDGIDKGELHFELGLFPEFGAPGVYAEELVYKGELNVWSGNLLDMDGTEPKDLTKAEIVTREHVMRIADFLKKRAPGFEESRIECTSTQVGVRATRQIIGEVSPTIDQVKNKKFEDAVVKPYARNEIRLPYRSILPQKVDNLLVAGRCISADEEAMAQLRLIPVCSATGQAAGTAAALAIKQRVLPRHIDIFSLQKVLNEQGMRL